MRTVFNCLTKANHCTTGFQVFRTMMSLDTYATLSPNRKKNSNESRLGHSFASQLPIRTYIIINQWELKVKTGNLLEKKKNSCDCFFSFIILWTRRDRDDLSSKWLVLKFPWNPVVKKPRADTHPKYLRGCHVRFFRCVQYQKVTDRLLYISRNNW